MSEPKLISPMLDNFIMGDPVSDHDGVRCCPAMEKESNDKYIVKIISVPATAAQLDALLLTGAFPDETSALAYFKDVASNILEEVNVLQQLSEQEGFLPFDKCQMAPMESGKGYDVYLLSAYQRTLEKHFKRHTFTHLDALNLGLDLCAALSVSRRSGYMYVDLKPSNIYVTEQQYRIGDLGFIPARSLKYISLPEKYRSVYTPGEISDVYSSLNTTMDIYAVGLILYQAFNNGELPFNDELLPGDRLPAPQYADQEMSEIILKACDPNPDARWQDPTQMGQAIVEYMQRNGAKDTPIIPLPVIETALSEETELPLTDGEKVAPIPKAGVAVKEEKIIFTEDEFGNLTFLSDVSIEDLGISEDPKTYGELTGEVSEMLTQADELAAITVPKPVVVPEHIDLPEVQPPVHKTEKVTSNVSTQPPVVQVLLSDADDPVSKEEDIAPSVDKSTPDRPAKREKKKQSKRHILLFTVSAVLLLLALILGGIYIYKEFYLLPIDSIQVEGSESSLTVYVETSVDNALLQVICVDVYGNQTPASLINGKAEFRNLIPNTAYNIKLVASGFHKLVGRTSAAYSTPIQTNVVQFDAITGIANGSVILNIAIEGPDSSLWQVAYSAEGEEERFATFTAHSVALNDLTIGKEYTFRLVPQEHLYLTGQDVIHFTPLKIVRAENVQIVSCINRTLTVKWDAPDNESISGWVISCAGANYSQTISTTDTNVTFRDLDHTGAYTVEVKANYMSVGEKVSIPANTATVSNLQVDTTVKTALHITWDTSLPVPADGWVLHYSVAGIDNTKGFACEQNSATITNMIPNATYHVWLTDTKGNRLLSSEHEIKTGPAVDYYQDFETFKISRSDMEFQMCKTLSILDWNGGNMKGIEFTTSFPSGQAASFLVKLLTEQASSDDHVTVMYVIRSMDGTPTYTSVISGTWSSLWSNGYCKLYIPAMPTAVGTYTAEVYFNNGLVTSQAFSIT